MGFSLKYRNITIRNNDLPVVAASLVIARLKGSVIESNMIRPTLVRDEHGIRRPIFKESDLPLAFERFSSELGLGLSIAKRGPDFFELRDDRNTIVIPKYHARLMLGEFPIWQEFYTPCSRDLHGITVLDVGAGAGETAYFFLKNGAKKVIAVEKDPVVAGYLRANCETNNWNISVVEESFSLETLAKIGTHFDFMKVDVEGDESCLLQLESLPCEAVIEVHSHELKEAFERRFKAKLLCGMGNLLKPDIFLMRAK